MRLPHIAALMALACTPAPSLGWGQTGHRITGAIAERHLSGLARAQIELILGTESLAEASTWPDEMRSFQSDYWQREATPWHYVTVPAGETYRLVHVPAEGDAGQALQRFARVLRDERSSLEEKQRALRFIIHVVGDLHQPLHAGRPGDRGGNSVRVTYFGEETNLHSVWDSALIESRGLSYTEYADWLTRRLTPQQVVAWWNTDPAVWIAESVTLRETIYPADPTLSYAYGFQQRPNLDRRLLQGGIRIAAVLNRIYKS